jgi:hypothetical protein
MPVAALGDTDTAKATMDAEQLQPRLDEAEKAMKAAIEEACDQDLTEVDTGELIGLEEMLTNASEAAKAAVSIRLKRRSEVARSGKQEKADPSDVDAPPMAHRVFSDAHGQEWHAFSVQGSQETAARTLPEAYRQGWLVFESTNEVRRIAPIPEGWVKLSDEELRVLCRKATSAPRRRALPPEHPPGPGRPLSP